MNSKVPKLRFKEFGGEWEEKELRSITSAIFDGTHQTPKYTDSGIPFFSVENLISGKKNKFISIDDHEEATKKNKPEKGDILMTRIGNIGFSTIISWDYEFSIYVTLAVIKKSEKFNSYYLNYYFQSPRYQSEIMSKSLLNAVPCKINMDELRKTKILLPEDEKEQQKIANCFSSLDYLIESQNKKLKALKKHKKGLMQNLFPKDGEKEPKLRFDGFSGEWEEKTIDDLANRYDNLRIPITASDRIDGITPYYGANGIQGYIEGYTHDGEFILVAEDGANDLKNYPVQYVNGKIWVNNHAHVLQAKENISNNIFLMYVVKNMNIEPYLVGGGRAKLNANIMMKISCLIPKPQEQQKIANCLMSLDNLLEEQNKKIETLEKHKKGLMQGLFVNE